MTVFTHFLFFVRPEAARLLTPAAALPWVPGEALHSLAPLSAEVMAAITDAPSAYDLVSVRPSGADWQRGPSMAAAPLTIDSSLTQAVIGIPALPDLGPITLHLGLRHRPSNTLIGVSNAFVCGQAPPESRRLRYRNFAPSLLGSYLDPGFACELRLPLTVGWADYPEGYAPDPLTPRAYRLQRRYRLLTTPWPPAWVEALQIALRHDEVMISTPLAQFELIQLTGELAVVTPQDVPLGFAQVAGHLRSLSFSPLSLLYDLPAGGFDAGFSQAFSL